METLLANAEVAIVVVLTLCVVLLLEPLLLLGLFRLMERGMRRHRLQQQIAGLRTRVEDLKRTAGLRPE